MHRVISDQALAEVVAQATAAYPSECCGYIADVVHPCVNGAARPRTEYEFLAEDLLGFARAFDSEHAPTVVYHSHPDGRATMSRRDRDIAMAVGGDQPAHPVDHLIIATGPHGRFVEAALFAWSVEDRDFLEVRQWPRNT